MPPHAENSTRRPSGQSLLLAAVIVVSVVVVGYLVVVQQHPTSAAAAPQKNSSQLTLADIPFNGQRAYDYLQQICALGSRVSNTPGMLAQQKMLEEYFTNLGAKVHLQKYRVRHPANGSAVPMANLIVEWHPERRERILLATHYDTRPFPDKDPRNPRGTFVGANDGASGTALLMELGRSIPDMPGELGVDFVFFDGEEFVLQDGRDPYFIGSEYFATQYAKEPGNFRYRYGVLLDMVGDADLQIYPDRSSMTWKDTRPLVDQIWGTAKRLGVREFVANNRYDVLDDHIKLHDIGKITCIDIIDFKYPAWHTEEDTPERCSALSLAKVGWVLEEWLKQAVRR